MPLLVIIFSYMIFFDRSSGPRCEQDTDNNILVFAAFLFLGGVRPAERVFVEYNKHAGHPAIEDK